MPMLVEVAIGIGLWVWPRKWILLRSTTNILPEGVQVGLDLAKVRKALSALLNVAGVHDPRVWSMTTENVTCTAHVVMIPDADPEIVRRAATGILARNFKIEHVTIQVEQQGAQEERHLHT